MIQINDFGATQDVDFVDNKPVGKKYANVAGHVVYINKSVTPQRAKRLIKKALPSILALLGLPEATPTWYV